jgi:para-aminobenzoate synthetase component 1
VVAITWDSEIIAFTSDQNYLFSKIEEVEIKPDEKGNLSINEDVAIDFSASTHREAVLSIQNEIVNGNVYELNLCSRFLHRNARLQNPGKLFDALIEVSPAPFSAYLNINNMFVMSASPERYILKNKNMLVCQPIKGTRPRNKNEEVDQELKRDLRFHTKDCAENVMIVDLIRNDLARVSSAGSVEVNELFGIYSFSHVHQMISTISSEIEPGKTWTDVLRATFPMGSMTGAPKIAAMKLIESFELSDREWYSGALGYIDPSGNMDFNVLIRSVFYDMEKHLLAYYAGGAITIDSNPEDEYNEMLIKASAIQSLISKLIQ